MKTELKVILLLALTQVGDQKQSNIERYIGNIIDNLPYNEYTEPTANDLAIWDRTVYDIDNNRLQSAKKRADSINYKIIRLKDGVEYYNILRSSENHWGTYVFNEKPFNDLVIQAPHPVYDNNTGEQAIYCFRQLDAKAFFVSGTHRCNSDKFSECDGTTSVCGDEEPFRTSDVPHNTKTAFHKATERMYKDCPSCVFIQFHGFDKKQKDPDIILSNGTRKVPKIDYCKVLKTNLLLEDNTLTFKLPHIDKTWKKLNGLTNVQGRLINGGSDPCEYNSPKVTGRFIHIEQSWKLRKDKANWQKMSKALSKTF